jgi:hypothetical protein
MKTSKLLISGALVFLAVATGFSALADHSANFRQIGRSAAYVKFDAENLVRNLARGRGPESVQLIHLAAMVGKEANDLEQVAARGHSRLVQREAREVFVAFNRLERQFRYGGPAHVYGHFDNLARSVARLHRDVYTGGGYDGGYDGQDGGYDGQDGGYDGQDGGYDDQDGGYDGQDGGYDGQDGGYDGGYDGQDGGYDGQDGGYDGQDGGYDGQDGGYDDGRIVR